MVDLNEKFGGFAVERKNRAKEMREAYEKVAGAMSKRSWWAVLWLFVGQAIQIVAHLLSNGMYIYRDVAFCISSGVLVMAAIIVGMLVGRK